MKFVTTKFLQIAAHALFSKFCYLKKRRVLVARLIPSLFLLLISTGILFVTPPSARADNSSFAIEKSDWHTDAKWPLILYYYSSWRGKRGLVDSETFYLSPEGNTDPKAELVATWKAFQEDAEGLWCRFPMRGKFLAAKAKAEGVDFKVTSCKELDEFLNSVDGESLALVFSSYYPNNPSSLFGHTFLRVNSRRTLANPETANLLDAGISFAAYPNTGNPLLYVYRGLFGGFPGRFDALPFYVKVQEYNHSENRDLWELNLNLNPDEVNDVLLSLWEVRLQHIEYYYFDDNCAFVLLHLLELARPSLKLKDHFNGWVIPSDTVRIVASQEGLIEKTEFRPSTYRRLRALLELLTSEEKHWLKTTLNKQAYEAMYSENPQRQALLLDTLLEYFDYDERLSGTREAVKWTGLRNQVLKARARLGSEHPEASQAENEVLARVVQTPFEEFPALGHAPTRIGLGVGRSQFSGNFVEVDWRPALHDLGSHYTGYSTGYEIQFFHPVGRFLVEEKKFQLNSFSLLKILSASPIQSMLNHTSWTLDISAERVSDFSNLWRKKAHFGFGLAAEPITHSRVYFFGFAETGHITEEGFYVGPGFRLGLTLPASTLFTFRSDVVGVYGFPQKSIYNRLELSSSMRARTSQNSEVSLEAKYNLRSKTPEGQFRFHYFL